MKKIEDKLLGSYYTPYRTIQFMKEYLAREHKIYGKVLEPSVGDGRFLDAFEKEESIEKIVAVELIEEKVGQLKNRGYLEQVEIVADDFLDFAEKTSEKYQLIIGNPPYINIKNMEKSGTGIGLFLSREIIEKHAGTITVTSGKKKKGSTFVIQLPYVG